MVSIDTYRDHLLAFSELSEADIRDIWWSHDDEFVTDLSTLQYYHGCPLYQKMIFRFRQYDLSAARLWNAIDPCNRDRLLRRFGLSGCDNIIDFLAWISNGLCESMIEGTPDKQKLWRENGIKYYFSLEKEDQIKLYIRYFQL